jgi:hypothetical protein
MNTPYELGDRLPNGATFIAQRGNVVLASWTKNLGLEYITWRRYHDNDFSTGNYFLDLQDAVNSLYDRSR